MGAGANQKMMNLARRYLESISKQEKDQLMLAVKDFILLKTQPQKIIFFGSILTSSFDSCSDIDTLIIYDTLETADQARRSLYQSKRPELGHSLEFICVDQESFLRKSKIGGICFVADTEGAVLYPYK